MSHLKKFWLFYWFLFLFFFGLAVTCMGQVSDATMVTKANTIKNEVTTAANTANRVGTLFLDVVNSKGNKIGTNAWTGVNTFKDGSNFSLLGSSDATKIARFDNSSISGTKLFGFPNMAGTFVVSPGGISTADPGTDAIAFWDDSANQLTWLTLGTNLSISGTTLNATGSGGGGVSLPISDATALLMDNVDNTKTARFELSGITTSTFLTYNLPNVNGGTLLLSGVTNTLSGNTTIGGNGTRSLTFGTGGNLLTGLGVLASTSVAISRTDGASEFETLDFGAGQAQMYSTDGVNLSAIRTRHDFNGATIVGTNSNGLSVDSLTSDRVQSFADFNGKFAMITNDGTPNNFVGQSFVMAGTSLTFVLNDIDGSEEFSAAVGGSSLQMFDASVQVTTPSIVLTSGADWAINGGTNFVNLTGAGSSIDVGGGSNRVTITGQEYTRINSADPFDIFTTTSAWALDGITGDSLQVLTSMGSGYQPRWVNASGGGGTPGGSDTQVQYNDGGAFGGDAGMTYNETTNTLSIEDIVGSTVDLSSDATIDGALTIGGVATFNGSNFIINGNASNAGFYRMTEDTDNGGNYVQIFAASSISSSFDLVLPADDGDAGEVLTTDGSGVLTWETSGGGITNAAANNEIPKSDGTNIVASGLFSSATGLITFNGTSSTQGRIELEEDTDNGTHGHIIQAPASLAADVTWTLPTDDGNDGEFLQTNGSGVLDWVALTGNDDTNVTIDITGGAITMGWQSTLSALRGGTGADNTTQTYTPTLTNTTNVAASTARLAQYHRNGNVVTVSGQIDLDPTSAAQTVLGISLPIASNFSTAFQCGGTAAPTAVADAVAGIIADATNDRATLQYTCVDVTNHVMTYTFTYIVL